MGGEKPSNRPPWTPWTGSPPRGRGKVWLVPSVSEWLGITPAWAGKRSIPCVSLFLLPDHPRVGGEKPSIKPLWTRWIGSPPRGRGKGPHIQPAGAVARITPAWAGKRPPHSDGNPATGDHPRVGGEKCAQPTLKGGRQGSPPRGRGKEVDEKDIVDHVGITPAWAGKRGTGSFL